MASFATPTTDGQDKPSGVSIGTAFTMMRVCARHNQRQLGAVAEAVIDGTLTDLSTSI